MKKVAGLNPIVTNPERSALRSQFSWVHVISFGQLSRMIGKPWLRVKGVLIWPIMEINFMAFSERRERYLPAAYYVTKKYWSKPMLLQVEGQRLCVILLYAPFSCAISHKWHLFKLQNRSSHTIFEQSSPNFEDMFYACKCRKRCHGILIYAFKPELWNFENLGSVFSTIF